MTPEHEGGVEFERIVAALGEPALVLPVRWPGGTDAEDHLQKHCFWLCSEVPNSLRADLGALAMTEPASFSIFSELSAEIQDLCTKRLACSAVFDRTSKRWTFFDVCSKHEGVVAKPGAH